MKYQLLNPIGWNKSFLLWILVFALVVWFGFFDTYSLYTRYQLRRQKAELEYKIKLLSEETKVLEQKIQELHSKPDLLERIAREEYGMRKKNEKVYRVVTPKKD